MRIVIREKRKKDGGNIIIRDFDHTKSYSLDKENLVLELTHEDTNHKVIYPLSYSEYVAIMPDTEVDNV